MTEPTVESFTLTEPAVQPFTSKDLRSYVHPWEKPRFVLAVVVCTILGGIFVLLVLASLGTLLLVVAAVIATIWFFVQVAKANFLGHSVKVYKNNFPEIYAMLERSKARLGFKGHVDIYIIEEGSVNASLAKFFGTRFIVLHSGMAEGIDTADGRAQVEFVIARFVGALKAKHLRFSLLMLLIDSVERLVVFNLFLLPYERAVQFSGDQVGFAVCGDLTNALQAMTRMMVGNSLYRGVNPSSILYQAQEVFGLFGDVAALFSTHPHMVHRYTNLLAFARKHFPERFEEYVSKQEPELRSKLDLALRLVAAHN